MNIFFISGATVLIIAYAFYNTITLTEYFKEVSSFNDEQCTNIKGVLGIADMIQYDYYLIGGADNHLQASISNSFELTSLPNGQMVAFNTITKTFLFLLILNFPVDIPFHPHGVFLFQNQFLYIINHSFTKGERVEIIRITNSPLTLYYERSIVLPEGFNRITNDLVVIDKDELYITTSNAISQDNTDSIIKKNVFNYLNFFSIIFRINLTYVYHYKKKTMTKVPYSNSLFNNGIEYDSSKHLLYIAQTLHKRIRVVKVNPKSDSDVQFVKDINLQYAVNNISFDHNRQLLIATIVGKVYQTIQLSKHYSKKGNTDIDEIYGGALQIDINKNNEVSLLVLNKNQLKGVSSALRLNTNIYLSSFADNGILICPIKQTNRKH